MLHLRRERCVWFWTLAVELALWYTPGLAGTLIERNLLGVSFGFVLLLSLPSLGMDGPRPRVVEDLHPFLAAARRSNA